MPSNCDYNRTLPIQDAGVGDFVPAKVPFSGGSGATESIPQWNMDEFFELNEFNQSYGCMDTGTSKVFSSSVEYLIILFMTMLRVC